MDYFANRHVLESMYSEMKKDPYIQNGSINFWYPSYINYLKTSTDKSVFSQMAKVLASVRVTVVLTSSDVHMLFLVGQLCANSC
jgi:hypothetical protein